MSCRRFSRSYWLMLLVFVFFVVVADFVENPVLSEEYLQARNAEIVVGPIELASCMDLSEQGGCVTLTSPKLLKSKGRNYLLHIKTMTDLSKDGQGKTRGKQTNGTGVGESWLRVQNNVGCFFPSNTLLFGVT